VRQSYVREGVGLKNPHPTAMFRCLPLLKGWSELAQVSGKECKDMAHILLGCIVGKVPSPIIACYRALLDFIYIAQYTTHNDSSLKYLEEALEEFQAHKDVLIELDVQEHLNIPKFHSMVYYMQAIKEYDTTDNYNTEMFEHFHIDCAKEVWRASNSRNEVPQMMQWLSCQEKVAMFQGYLEAMSINYTLTSIPLWAVATPFHALNFPMLICLSTNWMSSTPSSFH